MPSTLGIVASAYTLFSITDSFNRADSAVTLGNTDTGQPWTYQSGTWGISSNTAYVTSTGQHTAVVNAGVSDCTVQATMSSIGTSPGLCWRATDDNNYFLFAGPTCYKRVAGGFTSLGSTGGFSNGDVLSVVVSGTSHIIKKNGTTVLSFTESFNQTATKHGLRAQANDSRFDNFSVTVP